MTREYAIHVPPACVTDGEEPDAARWFAMWEDAALRDGWEPAGPPRFVQSTPDPLFSDEPAVQYMVIGPATPPRDLSRQAINARMRAAGYRDPYGRDLTPEQHWSSLT